MTTVSAAFLGGLAEVDEAVTMIIPVHLISLRAL
jgi:hypothetical protein